MNQLFLTTLRNIASAILQDTWLGMKAFSIAFQANELSEETSQSAVNLHSLHIYLLIKIHIVYNSDTCSDSLGVELSQQPLEDKHGE